MAEAIIAAACEFGGKEGMRKIVRIDVRVGELQAIELGFLRFALSQLKTEKLPQTRFIVRSGKAKLRCRVCGHGWIYDKRKLDEKESEAIHFVPEVAHAYIKCSKCGSPDFEILEGRGVWIESMKGE